MVTDDADRMEEDATLRDDMLRILGLPEAVVDDILKAVSDGSYQDIWDALVQANDHMGYWGVVGCSDERHWVGHYYQNTVAEYVNTGDTYATTLLYDTENETLHVISWGDWYEAWEAQKLADGDIQTFEEMIG